MRKKFTLILFMTFAITSGIFAQQRYLDEVFTDVEVTSDVTYGVNATVLYLPSGVGAVPEELKMDVYQPAGDSLAERPLVLVFHTGNFLPNVTNGQISGTKTDSSVVEICSQLARRGYVAAACTYRLGWNPLAPTQPERALGLIQAAYRGVQDGRTAVRYFRKNHAEDGNEFGVDPTRITAWGNGTGGYLTLAVGHLDDYLEIPMTTNGPAKFVLDLDGDQIPETPMVVPQYHGDIEGKALTIVPADGFGFEAGDTTNYPNHVNYSSEINLVLNAGGALGDLGWIDENSVPTISVQSAYDIFAPYEDEVLIVPTTNDPIVRVQGAKAFQPVLNELGIHDMWLGQASLDNATTDAAIANSATAGHDYFEALYPFTNDPNSLGIDEGAVLDWWDPNAPAPGQGMGIPWNLLPHPSGGTFHDQGLVLNEGMSAAKAKANIAIVMDFFAPRACIALNLGCDDTGIEDVVLDASVMDVYPNPATTQITVDGKDRVIEKVEIYGMDGKMYGQNRNVNSTSATIQNNNLPVGMYFVKAYFEDGVATQKVMFN